MTIPQAKRYLFAAGIAAGTALGATLGYGLSSKGDQSTSRVDHYLSAVTGGVFGLIVTGTAAGSMGRRNEIDWDGYMRRIQSLERDDSVPEGRSASELLKIFEQRLDAGFRPLKMAADAIVALRPTDPAFFAKVFDLMQNAPKRESQGIQQSFVYYAGSVGRRDSLHVVDTQTYALHTLPIIELARRLDIPPDQFRDQLIKLARSVLNSKARGSKDDKIEILSFVIDTLGQVSRRYDALFQDTQYQSLYSLIGKGTSLEEAYGEVARLALETSGVRDKTTRFRPNKYCVRSLAKHVVVDPYIFDEVLRIWDLVDQRGLILAAGELKNDSHRL